MQRPEHRLYVMERVGLQIALARKAKGWSQRKLSLMTNGEFSHKSIGKWERGQRDVTAAKLARLADVLDVNPGFFFGPTYPVGVEEM